MDIENKIESLIDESKTAQEPSIVAVEDVNAEIEVDVSEHVAALVEGEELSEEFKAKAATIFESAVVSRVKQEIAKLEESFDVRVADAVQTEKEGLIEQVDGYLGYVAESWMSENEIALESGMKSEILEGFVTGLKGLFEEHYIDVPEEKLDVLSVLEAHNAKIETQLDEQTASNIKLKRVLIEAVRREVVAELSEGLTDTDVEKFVALSEDISFDSVENFTTKVKTIRESFFAKQKSTVKTVVTDNPIDESEDDAYMDPQIRQYLNSMKSLNKS